MAEAPGNGVDGANGRAKARIRVFALASFKGSLYASDDTGKCYRYDGDQNWSFCGQVGNEHRLNTMMVYRGNLYASHEGFFRYEGAPPGHELARAIRTPQHRCIR